MSEAGSNPFHAAGAGGPAADTFAAKPSKWRLASVALTLGAALGLPLIAAGDLWLEDPIALVGALVCLSPWLSILGGLGIRAALPHQYRVTSDRLILPGVISSWEVPIADLTVRREPARLERAVRPVSLPGFRVGRGRADGRSIWVSATDLYDGLLLERVDEAWFISPADPDGLCDALRARGAAILS